MEFRRGYYLKRDMIKNADFSVLIPSKIQNPRLKLVKTAVILQIIVSGMRHKSWQKEILIKSTLSYPVIRAQSFKGTVN